VSCSHSKHNNPNRKFYIGVFKLDLEKSNLGHYQSDSSIYENLTLELKENDSFYFSKNAPFIRKIKGEWTMKPIDNLFISYLLYDSSEYGRVEDQVLIVNKYGIEIPSPIGNIIIGKEGQRFAEYLFFKRK
jgi:hypothetical protein